MSNELFVGDICELDDRKVKSYFARFGSRIINYESHRHRPTNSCCFALITFVSSHTVNAILRRRPHSINNNTLFVKRLLSPETCSFIERLLPVSSIFVYNKTNRKFDERKLKYYFKKFGLIVKFQYDHIHDCLFIEYDDYDSIDKIFLNKEDLPYSIEIYKNILPYIQNSIQYTGTCHYQQRSIIDSKKQNYMKSNFGDNEYQDLLQKTIKNLVHCKTQLRNKENDYIILEMGKFIMSFESLFYFFLLRICCS